MKVGIVLLGLIVVILVSPFGSLAQQAEQKKVDIPETLEECFPALKKILKKSDIDKMRNGTEEDMIDYHMGLGCWIRNNWGLWGGSKLRKWFLARGIHHPDDMSGIILDSFWRHLKKKPLKVDEQMNFYRGFWEIRKSPPRFECPKRREPIEVKYRLVEDKGRRKLGRCLHVGYCKTENAFYVYELGKGWNKPSTKVLQRIKVLEDEGSKGLIEAPLDTPVEGIRKGGQMRVLTK